ncbi:MAG TPA: GTP cyclohydrolase I FolE [Gemmatimonadales bacterium]|nr:GTP cyclohydrolase I FolE [Gemmatimonadales bacterium]
MPILRPLPVTAVASGEPSTADPEIGRVARKFGEVLDALGLDRSDPHLRGSEFRVARAYRELLAGLRAGAEPELRTFPNTEGYRRMVAVTGVPFYSLCAHHFLPFFGVAHLAYLPEARIVGLSKLARVVEFYARRPQVQERLTQQIIGLLDDRLAPAGAMVVLQARHLCLEMRGVGKPGLVTTTSAVRGAFEDDRWRQEFLAMLPATPTAGGV